MTAHDLIDSIFGRVQPSSRLPANMRWMTRQQMDYLKNLIGQDPEGGAVRNGQGGSLVWAPSGRHKYVITEDPRGGDANKLTKFSDIRSSGAGKLFDY